MHWKCKKLSILIKAAVYVGIGIAIMIVKYWNTSVVIQNPQSMPPTLALTPKFSKELSPAPAGTPRPGCSGPGGSCSGWSLPCAVLLLNVSAITLTQNPGIQFPVITQLHWNCPHVTSNTLFFFLVFSVFKSLFDLLSFLKLHLLIFCNVFHHFHNFFFFYLSFLWQVCCWFFYT